MTGVAKSKKYGAGDRFLPFPLFAGGLLWVCLIDEGSLLEWQKRVDRLGP